jgi:O-succinylbenzoic acid--CoA ligase
MIDEDATRLREAWAGWTATQKTAHIGLTTSGSSGAAPKIVALTYDAILANAASANRWINSTAEDVWLRALPEFHIGGLAIAARASLTGATVIDSSSDKWSVASFLTEVASSRATVISLVPTQVYDLVLYFEQTGQRAPSSVRAVIVGGGRLDAQLLARARAAGWPCLVSYGMTECCSQVATARTADDARLFALDHANVRIAENGRIEIQSDALLTGYVRPSSHELFEHNDPKREGWFATEDFGALESDGSLSVLGRSSEFVKISGENVSLVRLEQKFAAVRDQIFQSHSHVSFQPVKQNDGRDKFDFALFAVDDDRLGAKIAVLTNAQTLELHQRCIEEFNQSVMPFERARLNLRVAEIPRSPLGKLLLAEARALISSIG